MAPTKVAVCQILSTNDPAHNLKVSSAVVREAAKAGATAAFLPEAADFIALTTEECRALSFPLSAHPYTLGLRALAKELGIVISAGVHEVPEPGEADDEPAGSLRVYNTHVLIGKDGALLARYRKLHLFDVQLTSPPHPDGTIPPPTKSGESDRVRPGREIVPPVHVEGLGNIGLEICYDIRFPEQHTILTRLGADILTFPSAFTLKTGKDHWPTLNYQVYVLASAQYGAHNPTRSSWGETIAFDPWGKELGHLRSFEDTAEGDEAVSKTYAEGGEFFIAEIDTDVVQNTRKQIPLAIQKRSDVYGVVGKS